MKKNTGIELEKLTESIYKKLVRNPGFEEVKHNVKLQGKDGKRQIDVLVISKSVGETFITAIECKDFKRRITIGTLDGFHSKLLDINANKGILISRAGFSSKVISKAKRLGITLCTADQAEKENWETLIDLPILFKEIILEQFTVNIVHDSEKTQKIDRSFLRNINGIDFIELIKEKWKKVEFNIVNKTGTQELLFTELIDPLYSETLEGEKFEIKKLTVTAKIKIKRCLTSISKLKGTEILNNISKGERAIFIKEKSLFDLKYNMIELSKNEELEHTKFECKIEIFPHLNLDLENITINN